MRVYLAGPISGQSYDGATEWRSDFAAFLESIGHIPLSPLRGKFYLEGTAAIADSYEEIPMSSSRGIFGRDSFDCRNCDAIIVNFLDAKIVSIGSCMEVQMGRDFNKFVVVVMEPGSLHDHAFVREAATIVVDTLDKAKVALQMLGQGYASTTPTLPAAAVEAGPRRMWQVGIEGDRFDLHYENTYCGLAGCIPDPPNPPQPLIKSKLDNRK